MPGLIEVDAGQTFTLDDLTLGRPTPVRRSDEQKLALLADYEQATSRQRGQAWLLEHGLRCSHISAWRRLRETAKLPADAPGLTAAQYSSLSLQQKAALVREYQEAASRGQQQQWLMVKNLTLSRISRWQAVVRSTQQVVQPTAPQQPLPGVGGPSEIVVDPTADFGRLLSPTGPGTSFGPAPVPVPVPGPGPGPASGPGSGSVAVPGPIEVEAGQAFTLDDLDPARGRSHRRSAEEKLALLAEYEQATSQLRGKAWLREHGIDPRRVCEWRRLREAVELPAGDPRRAAVASSSLSLEQRASLIREYQEAVSHGQSEQWLAAMNLTRSRISRWQAQVRARRQRAVE